MVCMSARELADVIEHRIRHMKNLWIRACGEARQGSLLQGTIADGPVMPARGLTTVIIQIVRTSDLTVWLIHGSRPHGHGPV